MKLSNDTSTLFSKPIVIIFFAVIIGFHVVPYLRPYSLPHPDLLDVIHVINWIRFPEVYAQNSLTNYLVRFHTLTAPIYYYGIVYPLTYIFPPKYSLLSLGIIITVGSTYLAGRPWKKVRHLGLATLILILLISSNISTLHGNRRSFTALFLVMILTVGTDRRILVRLFITGMAAGIYPPVALLILAFYTFDELLYSRQQSKTKINTLLKRLFLLWLVFLIVLAPYWTQLLSVELFGTGNNLTTSKEMFYELDSISGLFKTFILGTRGKYKGALFVTQKHFEIFLIFLSVVLAQIYLLQENFKFKKAYFSLVLIVLFTWFGSHIFFPLLYVPFKFTRLSISLVLVFIASENLPEVINILTVKFQSLPTLRNIMGILSVGLLGVYLKMRLDMLVFTGSSWLNGYDAYLTRFALVVPLLIWVSTYYSQLKNSVELKFFLVILLFGGMVFIPVWPNKLYYNNVNINKLQGLFNKLQKSPPGSKIAGPPKLMMTVPAFGRRSSYNSLDRKAVDFLCDRNEEYWKALFSESLREFRQFLRRNEINYFLINYLTLKRKKIFGAKGCPRTFESGIVNENPILLNHLDKSVWNIGNKYFLLKKESFFSNENSG